MLQNAFIFLFNLDILEANNAEIKKNNFVRFLEEIRARKFASEIYWTLATLAFFEGNAA